MRILIFLILMTPVWVSAQLTQNLFIDTKAMSLGNAVTADPVGIMDIHFNPAGLSKLDGRQIQLNLMNIMLSAEADFSLPDESRYNPNQSGLLKINKDPVLQKPHSKSTAAAYIPGVGIMPMALPVLTLPAGGLSIKPVGSKFTFANAAYAPMAAGFAKEEGDAGRYQAKQVALQRFTYLSPTVAYQVNDQLSLGAGFLISHQAVAVKQDVRAPSVLVGVLEELQEAFGCFDEQGNPTGNEPLAPLITLCGGRIGPYYDVGELTLTTEQTVSPSYNLGLLWEPASWFSFGMAYQSASKNNLKGTYEIQYHDDFAEFFQNFRSSVIGAVGGAIFSLPTGVGSEAGNMTATLIYPQHFQTGVKFKIMGLHLNVDAGWTDYGVWDSLKFDFDRQVGFLSTAKTLAPGVVTDTSLYLPMGYESVWSFGYGMAYDLNSRTQLRMGYEPRQTSIPDDARSVQAPLGFAELYSLGLGYQWSMDTVIDLSISFMQSKETILADPQEGSRLYDPNNPYPNSSDGINRNCLTCSVTSPYPGLDVDTKLTIGAAGLTIRTRF